MGDTTIFDKKICPDTLTNTEHILSYQKPNFDIGKESSYGRIIVFIKVPCGPLEKWPYDGTRIVEIEGCRQGFL